MLDGCHQTGFALLVVLLHPHSTVTVHTFSIHVLPQKEAKGFSLFRRAFESHADGPQ